MRQSLILLLLIIAWTCLGADWGMDSNSRFSGNEKKAWEAFLAGVNCLQEQGDRKRAAEFFEQVLSEFPESHYAMDSKEIGGFLRRMVEEDRRWTEPHNLDALSVEHRIAYYIYHLRDVNCYQASQPGFCSVLTGFSKKQRGANAAMRLKEIGAPAIPALIQLLNDRRPTRSVGFWRDFYPSRTVLRFQDAAIQILNELLPTPFYQPHSTSAYFSTESPEVREKVIGLIKSWKKLNGQI